MRIYVYTWTDREYNDNKMRWTENEWTRCKCLNSRHNTKIIHLLVIPTQNIEANFLKDCDRYRQTVFTDKNYISYWSYPQNFKKKWGTKELQEKVKNIKMCILAEMQNCNSVKTLLVNGIESGVKAKSWKQHRSRNWTVSDSVRGRHHPCLSIVRM